jgi:DNA integrity scanning protein DisA with diadenylate cyclase activity
MVKIKKPRSKLKQIEEKILGMSIELAKKGEGALFVIGENIEYHSMIKQKLEPFNLFEKGSEKILRSLATIDGAVIIDREGNVISYGAMIKKTKPYVGYGTRHAAAMTASNKKNIAILCSEEERKVKIFRDGKFIIQIDALEKDVEKKIPEIATVLESVGAGFVGAIGAAALVPALGIALIPGVMIFGGGYYAVRSIIRLIKKIKK